MIFVTVGEQMGFGRLVRAVDDWAAGKDNICVHAQVADDGACYPHIETFDFCDPTAYINYFVQADLILGHAGMGTILQALELSKPLLILPRRAHLCETRNDHQVSTAEHFCRSHGISVAWNELELPLLLDNFENIQPPLSLRSAADCDLVSFLGNYFNGI